jgi:aspartate-semialdehyde dehydrogenase
MIRAAVVGATGIVGQQFLVALKGHPWIEVKALAASERSAGQSYRKAITDSATGAVRWFCDEPPVEDVMDLPVVNATELSTKGIDLVFSAIESGPAKTLEPQYAAEVPVISTASAFRYEDDVPILIPGVNPGHARLLETQRKRRGWKGFVTPNPNCTTIGLAVTLKPLHDAFGLNSVIMTSMQSMSGAGRSPGVIGLDILDNVIPFIPGEEEKVQKETQKILGTLEGDAIRPAPFVVSCSCSRVCVLEGHTEAVFASTQKPCDPASAIKAMREYDSGLVAAGLPSAPKHFILVSDDPFRPQPRLDRDNEGGMATTVGRVRQDAVLPNGIKYVLVSHNTKMGAARGAVLEAEMLIRAGYIG